MKPATGEPPSHGTQTIPASLDIALPTQKPWRPANFWVSFGHAGDGVCETFRAERNFRVHCVLSVFVIAAAFVLHLSPLRIALLVLVIAFVLFAELFNTAIEATVDLAMPEYHPLAKRAKDAAAGAVLVAACAAVLVGVFVFLPVIAPLLPQVAAPFFTILGVVFALVAVLAVWLVRRRASKAALHSPEIVPGTSTDLSRKLGIGVMLAAFIAASAYQMQHDAQATLARDEVRVCRPLRFGGEAHGHEPMMPLHEDRYLPFSAGVR